MLTLRSPLSCFLEKEGVSWSHLPLVHTSEFLAASESRLGSTREKHGESTASLVNFAFWSPSLICLLQFTFQSPQIAASFIPCSICGVLSIPFFIPPFLESASPFVFKSLLICYVENGISVYIHSIYHKKKRRHLKISLTSNNRSSWLKKLGSLHPIFGIHS